MNNLTPTSSPTTCPICGSKAEFAMEERVVVIKSREARVLEEFFRCETCDEEYMTPEQMRAGQDRAVRAIRTAEELLQADEIRAFRESNGLSQREFEQLLGVGPKTVVRWENGTVFQSKAVDTLIRVLVRNPTAMRDLAQVRGVDLKPRRYWSAGRGAWTAPYGKEVPEFLRKHEGEFEPVGEAWVDRTGRAQDLAKAAAA